MSIRRLPEDAVSKIKSSARVTSLNSAVSSLVKNALDASASKIHVQVDYRRGNCTVQDNGLGIHPRECDEDGGLGKLHCTSRDPASPSSHGTHGEFLFYVATLSLLVIRSRHYHSGLTSSLSIHHGKRLTRDHSDGTDQSFTMFEHGTRVDIRDLFGSMPVRVKHRAILFTERADVEREFKSLIRMVTALLLAWPSAVAVSLSEVETGKEVYLRAPDVLDHTTRTCRLFAQALLGDSSEVESWVPISASAGQLSVNGCIRTIPVASRKSQFISLGIQPVDSEHGANILFEEINKVFSASSFGIADDDVAARQTTPSKTTKGKARKAIEKWPMFYLQLQFHDDQLVDTSDCLSRDGNMSAVIDLVRAVCYGFLKKYNLRPRKFKQRQPQSATPKKLDQTWEDETLTHRPAASQMNWSSGREESPFDSWSRIKIGHRTATPAETKLAKADHQRKERLIGSEGQVLRRPFEDVSTTASAINSSNVSDGTIQELSSDWLQSILQTWKNPIFEATETPVARLDDNEGSHMQHAPTDAFNVTGTSLSARISRESLAQAEIIAQVDSKFILIKLPLDQNFTAAPQKNASHALFLVDQHAADERCRLEELMADYFEFGDGIWIAAVEVLEEPIVIEVSEKEGEMLQALTQYFRTWAIVYDVSSRSNSSLAGDQTSNVTISALPPSILERCCGEPRLLAELLRNEAWSFEEGSKSIKYTTQGRSATKPSFRGCPQGLLDMLHSRSCRSAIMFNDVLTAAECESLVRRLARCSFPFQCAHGRPSMAPLIDLGNINMKQNGFEYSRRQLERKETFTMHSVATWKEWMSTPDMTRGP